MVLYTHTHTSTFRKIIAGITILIILLFTIGLLIVQQNKDIVLADNQINRLNLEENEHMHIELDSTGDEVPVPNGYVGSKVAGENEIDTGYVIYEGEEEVIDSNVEEAQKTRNQYVWIPVPDASKMYGTDANGKKWGKLYEFTTDTGENIDLVTGAKPLNWSESDGIMNIKIDYENKEPDIIAAYDADSNLKNLEDKEITKHEFLIQLEQEFYSMIDSVEKYGGFYIGRYETGDLGKEYFVVQKNNNNITNETWYTMYSKCKTLKNKNTNIETGMIWGNQYDRTLIWLIESGNKTKEEIIVDSTSWGNARRGATGNNEYAKANNIYDLSGNALEYTMEKRGDKRTYRGLGNVTMRSQNVFITDANDSVGCRAMLYIK